MPWRQRCRVGAVAVLALLGAGLAALATVAAGAAGPAGVPAAVADRTAIAAGAEAADPGKRWWAHVRYLADDKLQGRLTGSPGYVAAAAYVAERFKEYGLAPAGTDGYLQPVRFEVQRVMAAASSLALQRDGREEALDIGRDALLGSRSPQPGTVAAQLVFVGYALHLPEAGYDDFAGQDLAGKVVVYVNGGPGDISGNLKAHAHAGPEFGKALERTGAIGSISIPNPRSMDIPWARMALSASQPGMRLAEAALQDTRKPMFAALFNPASADKLFAGSGHTIAELLALADAARPLPRFPLAVALRAKVVTTTGQVEASNVVGLLAGSDPALKDQYVVLSAHLDHLGVGEPIRGDSIYNGAMDNAAGVASLLEIARALHAGGEHGRKPRRSLIFLALCGEEKGLLGSRYFAGHPTVPGSALAADLNVDMFLPLYPLHFLTVEGLDESSLGDDARAVGAAAGVEVIPDRFPDRHAFIRSDQYSFIRKGVPALAFSFGAAPGSPEAKMQKDWLTNRYHAPSDDVDQPVDLPAAARFNQLILALAERVADEQARPAWKPTSFFRRFAQPDAR
ncbi:MAG TPA: M28 family metallopeptidase [Thermoanaerobaculia bacterium]|nr:M28 family metallopeptidase [Thermoanaerobaculia bacterium]